MCGAPSDKQARLVRHKTHEASRLKWLAAEATHSALEHFITVCKQRELVSVHTQQYRHPDVLLETLVLYLQHSATDSLSNCE